MDWARNMKQNDVELIEAYMWVVMTAVVSLSTCYFDVHFVFVTSHQLKIQNMYVWVKSEYYLTVSIVYVKWWGAHCMNIFWWTFGLWAQIFDDQIECVSL
jgi:hypothetical protein